MQKAIDLPGQDEEFANLVGRIRAMSDPTRLRILIILGENEGRFCVEELVRHFNLAQPTISHHLGKLLAAQLIESRRHGLYQYYYVRWPVLYQVLSSVEQLFGVNIVLPETRGN